MVRSGKVIAASCGISRPAPQAIGALVSEEIGPYRSATRLSGATVNASVRPEEAATPDRTATSRLSSPNRVGSGSVASLHAVQVALWASPTVGFPKAHPIARRRFDLPPAPAGNFKPSKAPRISELRWPTSALAFSGQVSAADPLAGYLQNGMPSQASSSIKRAARFVPQPASSSCPESSRRRRHDRQCLLARPAGHRAIRCGARGSLAGAGNGFSPSCGVSR